MEHESSELGAAGSSPAGRASFYNLPQLGWIRSPVDRCNEIVADRYSLLLERNYGARMGAFFYRCLIA
jgi:hypothetical protein